MIFKYWTLEHKKEIEAKADTYKIPNDVTDVVLQTLQILDDNYGKNRKIHDDGGYVAIILEEDEKERRESYLKILDEFHSLREDAEFEDMLLLDENGKEWHSDLYIVGSEYGITIIYFI